MDIVNQLIDQKSDKITIRSNKINQVDAHRCPAQNIKWNSMEQQTECIQIAKAQPGNCRNSDGISAPGGHESSCWMKRHPRHLVSHYALVGPVGPPEPC